METTSSGITVQSNRLSTVINTLTQSLVLLYQAIAVVVFVGSLISAYAWLKNPFIGGFFEQTMVINESVTRQAGKQWALQTSGFRLGDRLVSVAGYPISDASDLRKILESLQAGQTVKVVMRTLDGDTKEADITLQHLAFIDQISYFVIPAFLSLVFLILSLWIFGLRRTEAAGRTFSVLTTSLSIAVGTLFDLYTSHYFSYVWTTAVALAGGALVGLGIVFPQEMRVLYRRPYLRWIGFAAAIVLTLNAFRVLYDFQNPIAYIVAWRDIYVFVGISGLFYFGTLTYRALFSLSPVVKNQARTILFGAVLAFGPMVAWLLYTSIKAKLAPAQSTPFNPLFFVPLIIFPVVNGYVILRFRLLRTDYWLRQGMVYSLLTIFVIAAYGLLVSGLGLIFSIAMPSNNPYLIGGLVFLIAVFLDPIRTWLQSLIDSIFFRGQRAYEERLPLCFRQPTGAIFSKRIDSALSGYD